MDEIKGIRIVSLTGEKEYGIEDSEVREELANVVDGAPEELDSFKEAFEKFKEGGEALAGIAAEVAAVGKAVTDEAGRAKQAEQALEEKIEEIDSQINGGETYLVEPEVVKDKCYVNKDSKKWFDLSSVTGSWNFATAIYPIDKGEEYNITCGSIRDIGVWFLSTNSPISSSTTAVIADSNIPSDAQLSNYPITASNYPYLAITYYYGYEPKVERVNRDCIVNEISTIKNSIADIASSLSIEEEKEILSYEIKNYGLFVKTIFEDTIITNSGNRELSAGNATTNIIPLDWNYGIMINCAGYCYVAFYDENKNFIERKTSYRNVAEIPVSDFPANAKYIAFSYKISGLGIDNKTPDVFATQVKKYSFGGCGVFSSTIKKKRNTRPRIDIYTTDSEYVILSKLMDAFLTEDCDVYFEFGSYNFEGIYKDMYDVYGLGSSTASKELPLGGNCRYYLNNSTITGTYPANVTFSNGCKVFGNLNEPCGFELYDGTIIANNCGYCIHSESLGAVGFYKHYIKNVKFVQNGGSRPLGCGAGNSTILEVDSCSFISNTGFHDIAMHGIASTTYNRPAHTEVIVRNCSIPNGVKCNTLSVNETGVLIYIGNGSNVRPELTNGWELQELDAIDKGRQLALRSLFIAAGAEYNDTDQIIQKTAPWETEETWVKNTDGTYTYSEVPATVEHLPKHYYLNGLGDITEEEMVEIYSNTFQDMHANDITKYYRSQTFRYKFRTNLRSMGDFTSIGRDGKLYLESAFYANAAVEVVVLNFQKMKIDAVGAHNAFMFADSLKHVIGFLKESSASTNLSIPALRSINLITNRNVDLTKAILIYKRSILYMIQNATPTSAVTITLHPDAYARISNQPDILEALEAQPLITLVSA